MIPPVTSGIGTVDELGAFPKGLTEQAAHKADEGGPHENEADLKYQDRGL